MMKDTFFKLVKYFAITSSLITLGCILFTFFLLFTFDFNLSFIGLKFYFNQFSWCLEGVKISMSIVGVIFVLNRLQLMKESNFQNLIENKVKNLDKSLDKIVESNIVMYSEINKIKYDLLSSVINLNVGTCNLDDLRYNFNNFLKDRIILFEKCSKDYKLYHCKYPKNTNSYSYKSFEVIKDALLLPSIDYSEFNSDIYKLYQEVVYKFAQDKIVDDTTYLSYRDNFIKDI